jgi:hypothetical protein
LTVALAIGVGAIALPNLAHAQFFGDRYRYQQPFNRQPPPSQGFFGFPFFERPPPSQAPVESYRAPSPRKLTTRPAKTVMVIGDSMADWLGYGLEEVYADSTDVGVVRKVKPSYGLVRSEPRSDTPEWLQTIKDIPPAEKPDAIIVMLGLNDRVSLRDRQPRPTAKPVQPTDQPAQTPQDGQDKKPPAADAAQPSQQPADAAPASRLTPGASYEFHTDQWAELYAKRIDEMIAALKAQNVPVLWVGLPAIRGPHATSDMNYLDDLYRARAEKAGIVYVDIWDGFVDENGRYTVQGPDFEGQIRRLRTGDGVHFTKFGAVKLAHLVDQQLSRVLANRVLPVALPTPEAAAPAKPGTVRPAIGPVLPLAATGLGQGSNLLGGGAPGPAPADPTAERVLVRGDAVAAPVGRADDFSWPPHGTGANAPPQPAAAPQPPAASGKHTSTDGNNGTAPAIDAAAAAPNRIGR